MEHSFIFYFAIYNHPALLKVQFSRNLLEKEEKQREENERLRNELEEAKKQLELASAMLKKMEEERRPFDPALKPKIDNAMLRVQEMLRSKGNALAN